MTNPSRPLLSICIPTYNRAELLDVCLASVLPQVAEISGDVECVVSDNASPDDTSNVIERYRKQFQVAAFRNESNIGAIANIRLVAGERARGEFVYLIGDDDVLTRGAVARIVDALRANPTTDLIALNVGYRDESCRPSAQNAWGGVADEAERTLRARETSGLFPFEELLVPPNADFTASYSSVMRRSMWLAGNARSSAEPPYSSADSAYPNATIIARHMPGRTAVLIGQPSVIIYELPAERYSWAKVRALCVLVFYNQLLETYREAGVPRERLDPFYRYSLEHRSQELGDLIWNKASAGGVRDAIGFMRCNLRYPKLLARALAIAMMDPHAPRVFSVPLKSLVRLKNRER